MRVTLRQGNWLLALLLALAGCRQPTRPLRNGFLTPELESPRPENATLPQVMGVMPARDVMDVTETQQVALAETEEPHPAPRRHLRAVQRSAGETTEQAANVQPEVSAIGQLSTGDGGATDAQKVTAKIKAMETALDQMHLTLTRQQQRTVAQIREFLKEAKLAITGGDTDGAGTLAEKAAILLRELHS